MLRSPLSLLRASRLAAQAPRCARAASASAYKLHAHGDAASVLSLERGEVGAAAGDNLRVRWLAAGVDPLDLAAVRGDPAAAPFAPPLPAVPGSEGVAVVEEVGPDVTSVKPGDRVIPVKVRSPARALPARPPRERALPPARAMLTECFPRRFPRPPRRSPPWAPGARPRW